MKIGDRVRLTAAADEAGLSPRSRKGVVVGHGRRRYGRNGNELIRVQRDGIKIPETWAKVFWERDPCDAREALDSEVCKEEG